MYTRYLEIDFAEAFSKEGSNLWSSECKNKIRLVDYHEDNWFEYKDADR